MADEEKLSSVELATELTIAWLGNPNVRATAEDVPAFLRHMHSTIQELSGAKSSVADEPSEVSQAQEFLPAVSVRKSLASPDHILSMIDGKPYKTLRRHLSGHGLTPEEYRARYKLKPDYPMVAPSYSDHRRAVAKKLGLGQKMRRAPASQAALNGASKAPAAAGQPKRAPAKSATVAAPPAATRKAAPKPRGRPAKKA